MHGAGLEMLDGKASAVSTIGTADVYVLNEMVSFSCACICVQCIRFTVALHALVCVT